ncbi:MAG: hypothetical protein LH645_00520 [Actinomycetia bacterium]|nr:hypothetical protein [Actinomycetes bacterium]
MFGDRPALQIPIVAEVSKNLTPAWQANPSLTQAKVNSKQQFLDSPDLHDAVVGAVLGNQNSHNKMADFFTQGGEIQVTLVESLGELVHLYAQDGA